jgi:hypothetical protein
LVGAVGIENNDEWNFKDLRGMGRNVKSLKRNDEACKGILIAHSSLGFSRSVNFLIDFFLTTARNEQVGLWAQFRGTDGKPTNST